MRDSVVSLRSVYVPSPPVDSVGRPRWRGTGEGLGGPGEDDGKPPPATNSGPTSADKVGERRGAPGPEDMVEIVCGGTVSRGMLAERECVSVRV